MRRMARLSSALLLAGALTAPFPAVALTVFDPSNYQVHLLEAARLLEQIQNQLAGLRYQAAMLEGLSHDSTGSLTALWEEANRVLREAEGLGYRIEGFESAFDTLYPEAYSDPSFAQLRTALAAQLAENRQTIRSSDAVQNLIVRHQPETGAQVQELVAASQAAPGQTAAIQATNQLLAAVSGQLTDIQSLLIAQHRAVAAQAAQQGTERAAASAAHERFWRDATRGTPMPIDPFPEAR